MTRGLLLFPLVLSACVGRSVVGHQEGEEGMECGPVAVGCFAAEPELSPFPEGRFGSPVGACEPFTTAEPMLVESGGELAGGSFDCTEQPIRLAPGARFTLRGMALRNTRLVVTGGLDSTIVLAGVIAQDVQITLGDRAWLEIVEDSVIGNLVVEAAPEVEGRAVTVADTDAEELAIRTGARGEARFERTLVSRAVLDVGSVVAAQTVLGLTRIRADQMLLTASDLNAGEVEIRDGTVLDGGMSDTAIHRCGALRVANAAVHEVFFAPCDEPLRITAGTVAGSRLHGSLELGNVPVTMSAFLPRATDTITMGDSQIRDSIFCEIRHLVATEGTILCSACIPDVEGVTLTNVHVSSPECPSLEAAAMPEEPPM